MVLPELKALAGSLGISGTGGMRKSQLIAAIQEKQAQNAGGGDQGTAPKNSGESTAEVAAPAATETAAIETAATETAERPQGGETQQPRRERAPRRDDSAQQQEIKTDAGDAENPGGREGGGRENGREPREGAREGGGQRQRQRNNRNRDGQRDDNRGQRDDKPWSARRKPWSAR